jgi:hypothetical protein
MLRRGAVVLLLAGAIAIGWIALAPSGSESASATKPSPGAQGYSNIRAADYVGPETCGSCHEERFAQWSSSSHRVMNQLVAAEGAVVGDFGGVTLRYGDGEVRFETRGGEHTMSFWRGGRLERRFRVTRTIGSRYLQEYVGVLVVGPEPEGHWLYRTETRLPFGYWLRQRRWFHQQYFDSWYGAEYRDDDTLAVDPYRPDDQPWATRCAWCHNTYPFELRAKRSTARPKVGSGTERFFTMTSSKAPAPSLVRDNLLPVDRLVTVGISCESCHLGGREHAVNDEPISFAPRSPALHLRPGAPSLKGGRANNKLITTVCAQCHSTPSPRYPNGAAVRNSSEALDFQAGACASRAKCTNCHNPHEKGPGGGAPDQAAHLAACTTCHQQLRDPAAARSHAGHEPGQASCLDCHMPKMVQGVSHFVRSHRIQRPVTAAMIGAGAPNACNLCHLDKPLRWTLRSLAKGWGRRIRPKPEWAELYGPRLDRPVGRVWLAGKDANTRITAAAAYARSQLAKRSLPALIDRLDDPVAYYRMWMLFAVEDILGRRLEAGQYDPHGVPAARARAAARLKSRAAAGTL